MRTTVAIDDDLLQELRQQAHDEGTSLAKLINRFLRRGIQGERTVSEQQPPFRQRTYPMGEPRLNLDKALALAALLEDEEVAQKMALRK